MFEMTKIAVDNHVELINGDVFVGKIDDDIVIYRIFLTDIVLGNFLASIGTVKSNCNRATKCTVRYSVSVIHPATEMHLKKYVNHYEYRLESFAEYLKDTKLLGISWLTNIIDNKAENEVVYYKDEDSLIIADYKWNRKNIDDLYLLMIFKDSNLRSVRDLKDYKLLEKSKRAILSTIQTFGLLEKNVAIFFHYYPSYFRLHIHIVNISKSLGSLGSQYRNLYLNDVIKNLKLDPEYYMKDCFYISKSE